MAADERSKGHGVAFPPQFRHERVARAGERMHAVPRPVRDEDPGLPEARSCFDPTRGEGDDRTEEAAIPHPERERVRRAVGEAADADARAVDRAA